MGILAAFYLARRAEPVYETRASLWLQTADQKENSPIQGTNVLEGQGWAGLFTSLEVLEPVARKFKLYLKPAGGQAAKDRLFDDFRPLDGKQLVSGSYRLKVTESGYELREKKLGTLDSADTGEPVGEEAGFRWIPPIDSMKPGETVRFDLRTAAQTALSLRDNLRVIYNPRSGNLIRTRLQWEAPEEAARIHNAVVDTFMETAYRLKRRKLREVSSILEEQTNYASQRLRKAELALEEHRVQTVTLPRERGVAPVQGTSQADGASEGQDPVFGAYFEKKLTASQLQSRIRMLEEQLKKARAGQLNPVALRLSPSVQEAPSLNQTLEKLLRLRANRRTLLEQYTEQHPKVRELTRRIESLQQETVPNQLEQLLKQKRSQLENVRRQVQSYASQLKQVPSRSIEEARLKRNVEIAEKLYNDLMVRQKKAEVATSTAVPDLQVVDRAVPPSSPTSDPGRRLFLLASLAGFGLGITGVVLHDRFLDDHFRFPDEVSRELGVPMLGVIPDLERIGPGDDKSAEVVETFRAMRAHLDRIEPQQGGVIMVTSPAAEEGKSMVVVNLAMAYAAQGHRVLLIDADTRRGNLEDLVDASEGPGLIDCLEGRVSFGSAIQDTPVRRLSLLAHGGQMKKFDRNRLDSSDMIELLGKADREFDLVLVDTPPLTAGVDALAIGETVDKALLVLRAGHTSQELTRRKLESLSRFDIPVVGAVLNEVPTDAPFEYYRYYKYDAPAESDRTSHGDVGILPAG